MTQSEYEKICFIIDKNQTLIVKSWYDSEWIINNCGVAEIKKEIAKLVKE